MNSTRPGYPAQDSDYANPPTQHLPEKTVFAIIGGMVLVVIIVLAIFCIPRNGQVPTSYDQYGTQDEIFSIEIPRGWSKTEKGSIDSGDHYNGARISSGDAAIDIITDHGYALLVLPGQDPNERVKQELQKGLAGSMADHYASARLGFLIGYSETPRVDLANSGGVIDDSCISQWTGHGGPLGLKSFHGYRASFVGTGLDVEVLCGCPAGQWAAMKPVFDHVLSTLTIRSSTYSATMGTDDNGNPISSNSVTTPNGKTTTITTTPDGKTISTVTNSDQTTSDQGAAQPQPGPSHTIAPPPPAAPQNTPGQQDYAQPQQPQVPAQTPPNGSAAPQAPPIAQPQAQSSPNPGQ